MTTTPLPTSQLPDLPDERLAAAAQPTTTDAALPPLKPAKDVPTSYMASVGAWWSHKHEEMAIAEERLLRRLPSFQPATAIMPVPTSSDPDPLTARIQDFPIPAPGGASSGSSSRLSFFGRKAEPARYLHGLAFWTPKTEHKTKEVNVLLHGYGAALGFFFGNLQTFGEVSAQTGRRAYALDWLGMGLSSRPSPKELDPPPAPKLSSSATPEEQEAHALKQMQARVTHAEGFFVDSLEAWRKSIGAEKLALFGHSLGGYLSAAYTLKYPDRVSKLVLISPAGVPRNENRPAGGSPALPKKTTRSEFTEAGKTTEDEAADIAGAAQRELGQSRLDAKQDKPVKAAAPPTSRVRDLVYWAWEKGWSPFGLLRGLGPLAPKLVGAYSTRRFEGLSEADVRDMHSYIYSISTAKGSGEYCIHHLLEPGAHARWPLAERMSGVRVPVQAWYGSKDWMDIKGGYQVQKAMREAGNPHVEVHQVPNAGHHLYIDNAPAVNALLKRALSDLPASD